MLVYVVGFQPASDKEADGGFEWYYNEDYAINHLWDHLVNDPRPFTHAYTLVPVIIPDRYLNIDDRPLHELRPALQDRITAWIDKHLHLIEVGKKTP